MQSYFCGWYFKCQSPSETVAVIPAFHKTSGQKSCSVQLITDENSWSVHFPYTAFYSDGHTIQVGESRFGKKGISLDIHSDGLTANGTLRFGSLSPIKYDIMGPFCCVPFMECRHSVFSMKHAVTGELCLNGKSYVFSNGEGYIEGDRGRSFPEKYAWTQCLFPEGSLMLSVAEIPFAGFQFTGVIAVVLWKGKEYRLATYLGAKAVKIQNGEIVVSQGDMRLTARLLENEGRSLLAPVGGAMDRTIRENAACRAYYRFEKGGQTLFEFEVPNASFEYEYPR